MKITLSTFLFLTVFALNCYAQNLSHQAPQLGKVEKDAYMRNLNNYRNAINVKYDTLFKNKKDKEYFVNGLIEYNKFLFESGSIYFNWSEAEVYFQQIAKVLLKEKWTSEIKVKLVRSPEVNAFMIEDGTVYLNVGFLANIKNEAELAAVIGHEFGHYEHKDSYRSFKIWRKGQIQDIFLNGTLIGFLAKKNRYASFRDQEADADELGAELMINSPYNEYACVHVFRKFEMMDLKYKSSKKYRPSYFNDHPASASRLAKAKKRLKQSDTTGKRFFIVNEQLFNKLKRQAIDETILLNLQAFQFDDVIELCYRELLSYPDDEFYIFYLNEAIRRIMQLNPEKGNKFFITDNYSVSSKIILTPKNTPVVITNRKNALLGWEIKKLIYFVAPEILFYDDSVKMDKLPVNELSKGDTVKFVTYAEALSFFQKKQQLFNYGSAAFTTAMLASPKPFKINPISSLISRLNIYDTIYELVESFNHKIENQKINFIFNGIEVSKGVIGFGQSTKTPYYQDSISDLILSTFSKNSRSGYEHWLFDSINQEDRMRLLNFFHGIRLFHKPREIVISPATLVGERVLSEDSVVCDAVSLAPETSMLLARNNIKSTAIVDLDIYFRPSFGGLPTIYSLGSGDVVLTYYIYFIDYKRKKINYKTVVTHCEESQLTESVLKLYDYLPTDK